MNAAKPPPVPDDAAKPNVSPLSRVTSAQDLLASLLHELRQPLAVVALGVDTSRLELEQGMTERALRRLDDVAATLERLAGELSRVQHLRDSLGAQHGAGRVSVNDVVSASLAAAGPALEAAALRIELDLPAASPLAAGDGRLLREVLVSVLLLLAERHGRRPAGGNPPLSIGVEMSAAPPGVSIVLRGDAGGLLETLRPLQDRPGAAGQQPAGDSLAFLVSREMLRAMDASVEWQEGDGAAHLRIRLPRPADSD